MELSLPVKGRELTSQLATRSVSGQSQYATNARRQEQLEAAKRLAVNVVAKNEPPLPENQSVDDEFKEPARMWVEGPL